MSTLTTKPVPKRGTAAKWLLLIVGFLAGAVVFAAIGLVVSSRSIAPEVVSRIWASLTGRNLNIGVSQPTVVNRIQQMQRLETVVYTMDKVVTGEKSNPVFPDFLTGDRMLLMVHGEVVAGIDFSQLKPGDVKVDDKQVRLHLPDAQVFSTRLDNAKTRVYSRQTGLLVPTDPNLESQVREEAENQLQQAALANGVLKTAGQNAQATITSLLQGLGFSKVDFQ